MQRRNATALPSKRRLIVLACLAACALWVAPTRVAASASRLDVPPELLFGPMLLMPWAYSELVIGQKLTASLPHSQRAYRINRWHWQRAASPQPLLQDIEMAATAKTYAIQRRDAGYFLSFCVQLAVARDIGSWYCTPFAGPVRHFRRAPGPAALSSATLDVPPALFFGPRLQHSDLDLAVGQTLKASLWEPQRGYSVSRWRWRRAARPQPWPQDIETVTTFSETNHDEYTIQALDGGYFLSACIALRVTRDIGSEYCTPFMGPVRYDDALSCAADEDRAVAVTAPPPPPPPAVRAEPARGFLRLLPALDGQRWRDPVALLPWPAGGWAVAERAGRILRHRPGQTPCLLLDLTAAVGPLGGENGLLSLALDPQFPAAPFLYVYYTRGTLAARSLHSRLARFPVSDDRIRREEELALLEIQRLTSPYPDRGSHFGGALGFGPDGLLYLGIGDRNASEQATRLDSLLGKILRLDIRQATRARPYRIPATNPWRGQAPEAYARPYRTAPNLWRGQAPEVYARGFRNPWRLAFDPQDGALWVADVGRYTREEVNRVQAGANYGWPQWEGDRCRDPAACAAPHAAPVATYGHEQGNCAVIGGGVYRGAALPGLDGAYLFGDYCSGRVWALTPRADGGWRKRQLLQLPPGPRLMAFAFVGAKVYLLVGDGVNGAVLQLASSQHAPVGSG